MTDEDKLFHLACAHMVAKPGWTFSKALMKAKQDLQIKQLNPHVAAKRKTAKRASVQ